MTKELLSKWLLRTDSACRAIEAWMDAEKIPRTADNFARVYDAFESAIVSEAVEFARQNGGK